MEIIGHGMIASSLAPYADQLENVVVFASGVANSLTTDQQAYEREYALLDETLRACRQQNKRLVYFSSGGAIYGRTNSPRDETTPTFPTTLYGRHKLLCEAIIANSGAAYLILRLANLVGAAQNHFQLIPALIEQIKQGRLTIFAQATRDLLDVEDFARILVCLLESHQENDLITVASGYSIPIVEIAQELQRLLSVQVEMNIQEAGDEQRFNISKLYQILPQQAYFEANYYQTVLAKYATAYFDI